MSSQIDWSAWSREAVAMMQARNSAWKSRFELEGCPFRWDLPSATIRFSRAADIVEASIAVVGTTSVHSGTFLWSWANDVIPPAARRRLEEVRAFGAKHDLGLLVEPEFPSGRAEALEVSAIAGRILDAEGIFISPQEDVTTYLLLSAFRTEAL